MVAYSAYCSAVFSSSASSSINELYNTDEDNWYTQDHSETVNDPCKLGKLYILFELLLFVDLEPWTILNAYKYVSYSHLTECHLNVKNLGAVNIII